MTKKHVDPTQAPSESPNEAGEGATNLKLSVKRMRRLRSTVRGGASDAWTEASVSNGTINDTGSTSWTQSGGGGSFTASSP
jgi:hypothetical protein